MATPAIYVLYSKIVLDALSVSTNGSVNFSVNI
jgi:hypothetical protein